MSNKPDFEDLEDEIKEGLNFHFVQNYSEIIDILFPKVS